MLGVVKTMGSINEPVEVLGGMIGGALVGTFLGVYIAYGFIGPIAAKMNQTYEEDAQFYAIIRDCLVAYLQGHSAPIVVELARGNVPTTLQPSFHAMDEVLGTMPSDPLAADRDEPRAAPDRHPAAGRSPAATATMAAPGRWPTPTSSRR